MTDTLTKSAVTKAKILEAAEATFNNRGYEAAVLSGIARAAGVATPTVHSHFLTKVDLYQAVYGHKPISPEQARAFFLALVKAQDDSIDGAAKGLAIAVDLAHDLMEIPHGTA